MRSLTCRPWIVAGSLAILAGCGSQSASLPEMDAAIRDRLVLGLEANDAAQKAEAPPVILSARFGPSLRSAVMAHDGYITALAYEAEAMAGIGVATSARRPQLSANATVGGLREGPPVSETTTGAAGDLTLSQLIYDGGASGGAINRAQAAALAAQADRMDRANKIALEAARAWFDLWLANERLALLDRKTGDLADLMAQMDRMASNGLLDRAAIEGARRQHLDIQLERTGLNASRSEAALRFEKYFRQKPVALARPDALVSVEMVRARAVEWKTAPALKRAIAELFAAEAAAQEARSAFRPTVSLQAGVVSPIDRGDTTDVRAGLRLQYVFNDGGRRKARFEAAQKRVAALEAQVVEAQRAARSEAEAALVRLAALDRSLGIVSQQIELTASEVQIARSQIATGQSNLQQLVAAEVQQYRAADQQIQMQAERQVLLLSLAAGTGYLTELIGLAP